MPEKTQKLILLNEELHGLVDAKLQADIQSGDHKAFFLAFVMAKAYKTHEATMLLCKNGYGEDAFMLTRTLFELMVTAVYILHDKTDDMLTRYVSYDMVTRKEMYDYVLTQESLLAGLNKAIETQGKEGTIQEVEDGYTQVMEKYKYRNGWSDKSIKGMSETIGRPDMYNTVYRLQCTVSHTNARSMNEYVSVTDQGTIMNIGPNWDLAEKSMVILFDCFFHLAKEADAKFSWNISGGLEELSKKYAGEVSQLNAG